MTVNQLRSELKARNINSKGLKSQLVARLSKALKNEADKVEDGNKEGVADVESDSTDEKKTEVIISYDSVFLSVQMLLLCHPI